MASNQDIKTDLDNYVVNNIRSATGYNTDKFFGKLDPRQLYQHVKSRLTAGNGSCLVRTNTANATPVDTIGQMYEVDYEIEIICAYPPMRQNQMPNTDRQTNQILANVKSALVGTTVTIGGEKQRIYWDSENDLFQNEEVDAQLLALNAPGFVVEF